MEKLDIYNKVKCVPDNAKKPIQGGRLKGKTDINPMWRIKALTELFGPCGVGWYYKEVKQWTEVYGNEVCAFVNIELFIKIDGEWSQPIFGTGGNMLAQKEKSGVYVSDECFKMATTDALSVACKQLGIGADVYWESDSTKYNQNCTLSQSEEKATEEMLDEIRKEMDRTGINEKSIASVFNKKTLQEFTRSDYEIAMKKFQKTESLPPKSPDVPQEPVEYGGLPFR